MKDVTTKSTTSIATQEFNALSTTLVNDFIDFLDVSPQTVITYKKSLKQLFSFFAGQGIKNPTHDDFVQFKRYLEAAGKKPSTIALYIASSRRFFDWTEQRGIYKNIARGVKAPRISKSHKKDSFSGSELNSILKRIDRTTLEGKRDYAIMLLMMTGGLRTIEVTRANIDDIRTVAGTAIINIQGKGRAEKDAFIKLSRPVIEAINEYLTARGHVDAKAPLFVSVSRRNSGKRLTTRSISRICKNAMTRTGFISPRLTAHSFRHSAITIALINGTTLAEAQAFARHSNINTTMIYAHNIDRMKSNCELSITNSILFAGGLF